MQQIPLTLPLPPSYDETSFVVGPANQPACDWLAKWPDWPLPYRAVNIFGPSGSGKTIYPVYGGDGMRRFYFVA